MLRCTEKARRSPIILLALFVAICLYPVHAQAVEHDDLLVEPTGTFISLINKFSDDTGNVQILDEDGKDISAAFFSKNYSMFEIGEYGPLWSGFKDKNLTVSYDSDSPLRPLSILTFTPSKSFYQLCAAANGKKSVEANVTLSGRHTVNGSNATITGANNPSLSVSYS